MGLIFLVIWLIGLGRGRDDSAGRHGFLGSELLTRLSSSEPDGLTANGSAGCCLGPVARSQLRTVVSFTPKPPSDPGVHPHRRPTSAL